MTLLDWFNFARVAAAVALLFFAIPIAARRLGDRVIEPWYDDIVPSFLYASACLSVSATILGNWRLCYGGLMFVFVTGWIAATIAFASRRRWIWDPLAWRRGFLEVLHWFERREWRRLEQRFRLVKVVEITQALVIFGGLFLVVAVNRVSFALENCRFIGAQTYERAISLQALVNGDPWPRDGVAALLAAVTHISGADGATVIRFSGPIFLCLLVVAGGYCAWCHTRRLSAAFIASLLLAIYPAVLGFDSPGEAAGPEFAALYWILTVAMARFSWKYAAWSAGVAMLVHGEFTPVLAGTFLCVSAGVLSSVPARFTPGFLRIPAGAIGVAIAAFLLLPAPGREVAAEDAPRYQYESAARAVSSIAREYPRNKWMVVSPAQELSSTYGRGWHLQIYDFVRKHTPEQVARPDFRFDYTVDHLFVFVEKEPLPQAARGPAMAGDDYSYIYLTQSGRTTLEFQAGQLMAVYAASHKDARVYFEDEHLIVYRVSPVPHIKTL